jgi:hypothetical protein
VKLLGFNLHPQAVTLREQEDGLQIINILLTNDLNEGVILPQRTSGTWPACMQEVIAKAWESTTRKRRKLDSQSRETKESKILVTIQTRTEDLLFRNNTS